MIADLMIIPKWRWRPSGTGGEWQTIDVRLGWRQQEMAVSMHNVNMREIAKTEVSLESDRRGDLHIANVTC